MSEEVEKPAVCYETGLDEAFLVGTREELTALARSILQAMDRHSDQLEIAGIRTRSVPGSLTEVMSEVVLDGMLVVDNKQDRHAVINYFRVQNGQEPIDWEGREERLSHGAPS